MRFKPLEIIGIQLPVVDDARGEPVFEAGVRSKYFCASNKPMAQRGSPLKLYDVTGKDC